MGFKEEFRPKNFGLSDPQPYKFARSQWPGIHGFFIAWRLFWALWHMAWLVVSIYDNEDGAERDGDGLRWLIFLTNWSYLVLSLQSWVHLGIVLYHTAKGHTQQGDYGDNTSWYDKTLWVLTSVSYDAALLVTILYWGLIFEELTHALNIVTHAVTTLYAVSDMFLSATPWRLLHFIYTVVYAVIYVVFTIIYHLADGTNLDGDPYVYKPLDWSNTGTTTGLVVGLLLVAVPISQLVFFGLYKLRLYIAESCCGQTNEPGAASPMGKQVDDVELQVQP